MRPRPLTILFLLLAGAVVNVGVAWGCIELAQPDPRTLNFGTDSSLFGPFTVWPHRRGWPLPCLTIEDDSEEAILMLLNPCSYRPRWMFAINTLTYATALWLMLVTLDTLRRRLRTRHGLCPACAYPVGESSVCSECGRAVNARSTGATAA